MTRSNYMALALAVTFGAVLGFAFTTAGAAIAIREATEARERAELGLAEVIGIAAKDVTAARDNAAELQAQLDRKRPKNTGGR